MAVQRAVYPLLGASFGFEQIAVLSKMVLSLDDLLPKSLIAPRNQSTEHVKHLFVVKHGQSFVFVRCLMWRVAILLDVVRVVS
jgi:hypothetical protein